MPYGINKLTSVKGYYEEVKVHNVIKFNKTISVENFSNYKALTR